MKKLIIILLFLIPLFSSSQDSVCIKVINGIVLYVPCAINGSQKMPPNFTLDEWNYNISGNKLINVSEKVNISRYSIRQRKDRVDSLIYFLQNSSKVTDVVNTNIFNDIYLLIYKYERFGSDEIICFINSTDCSSQYGTGANYSGTKGFASKPYYSLAVKNKLLKLFTIKN